MNIDQLQKGVHVRVQHGLDHKKAPPTGQSYIDAREPHEGAVGVIIDTEYDGYVAWVHFPNGVDAPFWYHELDEVQDSEVPEDTGWEGKPLECCQKDDPECVMESEMEEQMPDIHIADFVRRQTPESKFSHWLLSDEELLDRIYQAWNNAKPGYRDGVMLVPVDPEGFFTGVVTLQEGDKLQGTFVSRQKGESPRKSMTLDSGKSDVASRKPPAVSVEIILYRDDVLAEDGEGTGHEWNVISVNANPVEGTVPMQPGTMMANHFHDDGGTQTGMTDAKFVEALREAYFFWKDRTFIG